jgi:tRNA nucleotidyltransferase (CCA-adding enzyme)
VGGVIIMKINMPEDVNKIINKLHQHDFKAYAVGGCVRDSLLGCNPNDWDITTSARPEAVKALFKQTIDTGLQHGTVTIRMNNESYEVTTFRIDGEYQDNRKPVEVAFTSDLVEDLKRRDFTINAMAYNNEEGVIDIFNGIKDLEEGIIRCVGNPEERFNEDALRMLRAVRFCAQLGFVIEDKTKEAIKNNAQLINYISAERINMELTKTLISDNPHFISYLVALNLMEQILDEFMVNVSLDQNNPHHIYTVDEHIFESLKHIEPTKTLRWTMLLHDIGKGYTKTTDESNRSHFYGHVEKSVQLSENILNRLKFDNKSRDEILKLVTFHDYRIKPEMKQVRKAVNKISDALFLDYLKVQRADVLAQSPQLQEEKLKNLEAIKTCYEKIKEEKQCTSLKDLKITGSDLINIGFNQGKEIGVILGQLLDLVIAQPQLNNKETLLEKAANMKSY